VSPVISFNLDQIMEPVGVGLRRAYVFLGLGLNAAIDPNHVNFHLPGKFTLSFIPEGQSSEEIKEFKEEFGRWIVANSLREVIESLAITLDRGHEICLAVANRKGIEASALSAFLRKGVVGKLVAWSNELGIQTPLKDHFFSITTARNCFSHRRGVLGKEDCDAAGRFVLRYLRPEFLIKAPSGKETIVPPDFQEPILAKDGGVFQMRIVENEKEFTVGSLLVLSPLEVRDILWTVWNTGLALKSGIIEFCKKNGVMVTEG
jgi:hypothetical protein